MRTEVITQIKEILKEAKTEQELEEIVTTIENAKGKLRLEKKAPGFWEVKTACWEMFACPPQIQNECPALIHRTHPCWEIEGTYCKLTEGGTRGDSTEICEACRVYRKYGHGEPIHITLYGKGLAAV